MNRQLYQMGGIGTLPMDFGQPLQVPQQPQPSFSSAQNITMNPLLNYGQSQLGQAGGTPLTMAGGGMSRLGYQEGGMGMEMMQPQMQDPMMQDQMQSQQMMEPPLQGMEGQQPDIKDPQQALEIIIQMLVAQGIPPEQAREIALQMVQAVAEGGVEEMSDERVEARFGGRIGYAGGGLTSIDRARDMLQSRAPSGEFLAYINPQEAGILKLMGGAGEDVNVRGVPSFFIKSIGKAIGSVAKGVTSAVKSVVKSPIGKAALTIAAIYATGGGAAFGGPGFGSAGTLFGPGGTLGGASGIFGSPVGGFGLEAMSTPGLLGVGGQFAPMSGTLFGSNSFLSGLTGGGGIGNLISKFGTNALISGAAGALGGALAGGIPQQEPGESDADYQNKVNQYKLLYQQGVSNPTLSTGINPSNLYPNNPFYPQRRAEGGRIGYQEGGIGNLIKQTTQEEFFGTPMMANGGHMRQSYFFGGISKAIKDIVSKVASKEATPDTSFTSNKLDELINKGDTDSKSIAFQQVKPLYNYTLEDLYNLRKENNDYIYAANGGRIGYELGSEVPTRENQAGVTELDYRDTGGFVPPIGIKERADDIPAMLSNNEFVFTADAVRNAGNGSVNKGAERMYGLMKQLEAGGMA
jgi:hypothetical protein